MPNVDSADVVAHDRQFYADSVEGPSAPATTSFTFATVDVTVSIATLSLGLTPLRFPVHRLEVTCQAKLHSRTRRAARMRAPVIRPEKIGQDELHFCLEYLRYTHEICERLNDVATASLIEVWLTRLSTEPGSYQRSCASFEGI